MLHRLIALCLLMSVSAPAVDTFRASPGINLKEVRVASADRSVHLTLAIFSSKDLRIQVIDNAPDDGIPKFAALPDAMAAYDCLAGCNGGFFTRQPFSPVGGVISDGRPISPVDRTSWMKGLLIVRAGTPDLIPTDSMQDTPDTTDLLQSGTWLVRDGQAETDNSRPQAARRTFIGHDGAGTWALGATDPCTLHELATLLRSPEVTVLLDLKFALNLDGGPSTGLWVKGIPDNFYLPERWPVRNYVGIVPRKNP